MQLTKTHISIYVYNLAVIISSMWISRTYNVEQQWMVFAVAAGLGVVWTAYFQYSMLPRLEAVTEEEEEVAPEEPPMQNR